MNIVPDRADLVFELRHVAAEDPEQCLEALRAAAARVSDQTGGAIELEVSNAYPGLETPASAAIVSDAQRWAAGSGTTKVAFGTEAGFFDRLGIPTIVCGPGSMAGQGHKADEFISLEQLVACDQMLDRVLRDLSA